MRKTVASLIVLVAMAALGPGTVLVAAADPANDSALVDKLFQPWDRQTSPGCAVAIMKDGKVEYERGYGMADLDHDLQDDSRYLPRRIDVKAIHRRCGPYAREGGQNLA